MSNAFYLSARAALLWPRRLFHPTIPLKHEEVRSILLICPDKLGETLLLPSFLKNLRARFPRAQQSLLAGPFPQQLFAEEHLDITDSRDMEAALRLKDRNCDLVLDLHAGPELGPAKLCAELGSRWRAGIDTGGRGYLFNIRPKTQARGSAAGMQTLLAALGAETALATPDLKLFPEDFAAAQARLVLEGMAQTPAVTIHPGGLNPERRWAQDNFSGLMNILRHWHGVSFILLGSEDEKQALMEIAAEAQTPALIAAGLNLRVAAALIASSKLFIGNNSGPLELARALGVPTLCAMNAEDTVPPAEKSTVLYSQDLRRISVSEMAQTADRLLGGEQQP